MAQRLGDPMAMAYALVSELAVSTYCAPEAPETFQAKQRRPIPSSRRSTTPISVTSTLPYPPGTK